MNTCTCESEYCQNAAHTGGAGACHAEATVNALYGALCAGCAAFCPADYLLTRVDADAHISDDNGDPVTVTYPVFVDANGCVDHFGAPKGASILVPLVLGFVAAVEPITRPDGTATLCFSRDAGLFCVQWVGSQGRFEGAVSIHLVDGERIDRSATWTPLGVAPKRIVDDFRLVWGDTGNGF